MSYPISHQKCSHTVRTTQSARDQLNDDGISRLVQKSAAIRVELEHSISEFNSQPDRDQQQPIGKSKLNVDHRIDVKMQKEVLPDLKWHEKVEDSVISVSLNRVNDQILVNQQLKSCIPRECFVWFDRLREYDANGSCFELLTSSTGDGLEPDIESEDCTLKRSRSRLQSKHSQQPQSNGLPKTNGVQNNAHDVSEIAENAQSLESSRCVNCGKCERCVKCAECRLAAEQSAKASLPVKSAAELKQNGHANAYQPLISSPSETGSNGIQSCSEQSELRITTNRQSTLSFESHSPGKVDSAHKEDMMVVHHSEAATKEMLDKHPSMDFSESKNFEELQSVRNLLRHLKEEHWDELAKEYGGAMYVALAKSEEKQLREAETTTIKWFDYTVLALAAISILCHWRCSFC